MPSATSEVMNLIRRVLRQIWKHSKFELPFQMLGSTRNPNHFDTEAATSSGIFYHYSTRVGKFEIPSSVVVLVKPMNENLLMVALKPDEWKALKSTTKFFRGI